MLICCWFIKLIIEMLCCKNVWLRNDFLIHFCKCKWFVTIFHYVFTDSDNEKFAVLPPSTTGSLTSITTTSVASSEPDPGSDKGGDDGGNAKLTGNGIAKEEAWWQTTIQVSIPFLIAGVGTIGAGIILGIVEVCLHINTLIWFDC